MEKSDALNLKDVVNLIKKRKLIILTIMLITILLSIIYGFKFLRPVYIADTNMIFGKSDGKTNIQELNSNNIFNQNLMNTYSEVAKSRNVAKLASDKLNGDISTEEIQNSIEVTTMEKTQLLTICAKSDSSEKAVKILNAVSESFRQKIIEIYPLANTYVLDDVQFSNVRSVNKGLFIGVSLFIGILLSIGSVFLVECYKSTKSNK